MKETERLRESAARSVATNRWAGPDTRGPGGHLRHRTASAAVWSFVGFAGQQGVRALAAIALARVDRTGELWRGGASADSDGIHVSLVRSRGGGNTHPRVRLGRSPHRHGRVYDGGDILRTCRAHRRVGRSGERFLPHAAATGRSASLSRCRVLGRDRGRPAKPPSAPTTHALRGAARVGGSPIRSRACDCRSSSGRQVLGARRPDPGNRRDHSCRFGSDGRSDPYPSLEESFYKIRGFSLRVFFASALSFAVRNADNAIIGRVLGPVQLAFYALSYRTMLVVVQGLSFTTNRATLPVFSQLQDQIMRLRNAYFAVSEMLAAVGFPLMALCAAGAPMAVPLIMGPPWAPAVPVIQILAVTGAQQSVISACSPAFLATGRADLALRYQILNATITVSAFIIGVHWGIIGVAVAYTIVSTLLWPVALVMLGGVLDFRLREYVRVLVPSASSTAVLVGAFIVVSECATAAGAGAWLGLVLAAVGGLVGLVATYYFAWRSDAERVLGGARDLVRGAGI